MLRTQIQFTEAQLEALKAKAAQLDVSVSEIVRQAVAAWLGHSAATDPAELRRRAREAAGRYSSGEGDIAREHDRYLSDTHGT